MKSSKKFMTRVLTAALALSMVAGTGICAAAVEDTEPTETTIVIAPADGNNDLSEKLDTLKEMLSEAAQTAYAKLSQTTLARLAKVVQKVKAADEIMVNAYAQDAELKTNFANQLIQIGEDAEKLIASADNDEEFEAQIMAVVQEKVEKLSAEVEAQSAENMAAAQAESDALLEEANAELEAIKAELQNKKTKAAEALKAKVDAIQQQIDAVKEQAEAAAQQAKDAIDQTAVAKLVKAQLKTKMAEKIMKEAEIQDAQIKVSVAEQVAQIRTETDELIAAIGDDEELVAGIQEQINQKIDQLLNDALAQLDQIWADAEEQAGALLAEADALTEEGQAQVAEEVEAFRVMLIQKAAEVQVEIDAVKEEITAKISEYKAYVQKVMSAIEEYIINKTTKVSEVEEGDFKYTIFDNCLTGSKRASLIDYMGDETEITVPAYTEEGIPVTSIDEGAFAGCTNLTKLEIPAEVTSIGENAFTDTAEDFTIYCYSDSYAQQYAEENGINYELLDAEEEDFYIDVSIVYEDENAYEDNVMALGTSVRFVAEGVNGVGDCTYSCYYRKVGDEKWTVKQGMKTHSETNEFSLTPKTAGDYEVCIKVIDSEKTLKKIYHEFTVEEKVETGSFISADTITLGESVTATAVPEDGMENCTYAFYFKRTSGDVWTKKQGFDTNNVVTITPDYATDYQICIKIKDENGSISKKYFDLQVVAPVEE